MEMKLKLIWDFYGEDAKPTAEHHVVHLKQFSEKENIPFFGAGIDSISEIHTIAYLIIDEKNMIPVRDALKPKRGERVEL